jgi:hypothetical protein
MYTIDFRPELNLLDISWRATFTPGAVVTYARALRAEVERCGLRPGYKLRMDMRRSAVQPQDALAVFAEQFADFPKASRIAVVTPSTLAGMQVKRVMTQAYMRVFRTAPEALHWLTAEDAQLAA